MSIPFFIMAHFQRFTWIQLCDAYTSAGPSDRPALASLLQLAEGQSVITGGVFWMFMASAVLIYSVAMSRSVFPHLTIRFGIASAILALVGTVGLALNPQLAFLQVLASFLLFVWSVAVGATLFRTASKPTSAAKPQSEPQPLRIKP